MVILINPTAHGGTATQKWARILPKVEERLGPFESLVPTNYADTNAYLKRMLSLGHTEFVAAGGDGTVNCMLQSLIKLVPPELLPRIKIGAIGLGSSNDYHKPMRADQQIEGVPCKLDFGATIRRDTGVLTYEVGEGALRTQYWIVNASLGVTADANLFFNTPNKVLSLLKRWTTAGAILYAALHTMATYQNRRIKLQVEHVPPIYVPVTNLGVVKSPHFSGDFCYDSPFEMIGGSFYIHLCEGMSLPRTLFTLWRLSQRRFSGLPQTRSWRAPRLTVQADKPFAVEFDGEVVTTRRASFSIRPKLVQVCA